MEIYFLVIQGRKRQSADDLFEDDDDDITKIAVSRTAALPWCCSGPTGIAFILAVVWPTVDRLNRSDCAV